MLATFFINQLKLYIMKINDNQNNQLIEVWKTGKNTINIQPQGIDIDFETAKQKIIPEIAMKFGNLQEKQELIQKLHDQIKTIEMCIIALNGDYIINLVKVGKCPF